jgi:hypothetical protein
VGSNRHRTRSSQSPEVATVRDRSNLRSLLQCSLIAARHSGGNVCFASPSQWWLALRINSDHRRRAATRPSIQWSNATRLWFRGKMPDRSGCIHFLKRNRTPRLEATLACDCTVLTTATQQSHRELNVTEKNETEMISRRRAFSVFGLAALSLALAPPVLTVSDAEAQQPSTSPQTGTATTTQTGTERRRERRGERSEQRQERRTARTERRQKRRTARTERRNERREARHERRTERTTGRADRSKQRNGTKPTTPSSPQ